MILTEDVQQINHESLSNIQESQQEENIKKLKLKSWLNKNMRIELIDGRKLLGLFLCTDRDANIILGMCSEYRPNNENDHARNLGLVIIKKSAIRKIEIDVQDVI